MQNYVFLLNADLTPLNMVHPARARELQDQGKAAVFCTYPYTLVLQQQVLNPTLQSYRLKIDPGSKFTGFAIQQGADIVFRMELKHRGLGISVGLTKRAGFRRRRRSRNLRYRKARFNRCKPPGWLAPSLSHRVQTVSTWIKRFSRYCPIVTLEIEQVRFDLQQLQNPEISGLDYQQGTLAGYEVREYLLEKWQRQCAYCGAKDTPLQIEHIHPKSRGGSDRVSNLCLACEPCNTKKGNQDVGDFLAGKPDVLKRVLAQAKAPLKDAAAVNSTRFAIVSMARQHCSDIRCWTGGRTKFNRCQQGLAKSHSLDAACVGESGAKVNILTAQPLLVDCKGQGSRQSRRVNASGFPAVKQPKAVYTHVRTGDVVAFVLTKDRKHVKQGKYTSRVRTPTAKGFEVLLNGFRVELSSMIGVKFKHKQDGYAYGF
ncbi:HNH endonuclease [Leptolyngbya sp. FACHB-321]|nr:HNH endonuclease [Leptolyngbya sp. FACHB-321]